MVRKKSIKNDSNQKLQSEFNNAITIFNTEGKKIPGVYDLLIRGGNSKTNHVFIENWSDLDLSIILETINSSILKQVKNLYCAIKNVFPYKLSITIVYTEDYFSTRHYHGIKPLYYQRVIGSSISLLSSPFPKKIDLDMKDLKIDCLSNLAYLIHDLRSRYLLLENNDDMLLQFFCHLVKRSKHFIRNALFVLSGYIDEEIGLELFKYHFPEIDENFPRILKSYKTSLSNYASDVNFLNNNIDEIFNVIEKIHVKVINYAEQHLI